MWLLVLTISLKSQFNHALDIRQVDFLPNEEICKSIGNTMTADLKAFNKDVETTIRCSKIR